MCGKGNWSIISRFFVPSKTTSQVASHAQKYFRRARSATPIQKRRGSIHDTRIVDSNIIHIPARQMYPEQKKEDPDISYLINPSPSTYYNSEPNHYTPVFPITSPMYPEEEGPATISHLVNSSPPSTYNNLTPNDYAPFIPLTSPMYNNSSQINPHPCTYDNSDPDYSAPIIPIKSPMYTEGQQGPSDISHFVNSPRSYTYNNPKPNHHAPFIPTTSLMDGKHNPINPTPCTHYSQSNHYAPFIPVTSLVYSGEQEEPPYIHHLANSHPSCAYNDSTPNDYAPFSPITSDYAPFSPITRPLYPEQEEPFDISHLVNPSPPYIYNSYEPKSPCTGY